MDRRAFVATLAGGLLAAPLAAEGQQAGKVHRIGVLWAGPVREQVLPFMQTFEHALGQLGYTQGRNIVIDYRFPETTAQLPSHASDLARLKVDVIVASVNTMITPAKQATATIPIVMVYGVDPIGQRYIASLARPGGNITGLAWDPAPEFFGKYVDFLMELFVGPLLFVNKREIADLAAQHRLPTVFNYREGPESGGLMSYGPNLLDAWRRAAGYVHKILNGVKPADLPVEQPTKFELVINLKTAKALGLTIPQSLLQRADQVIE